MLNIIGKLLINIVALLVVEYVIPGFELADPTSAVVAVIIIGMVNTFIRPTARWRTPGRINTATPGRTGTRSPSSSIAASGPASRM